MSKTKVRLEMSPLFRGITSGLLAGAAGSTALNLFSYAQQAIKGTPTWVTPEQTANALVEAIGQQVPGVPEVRQNRLDALGPLGGYAVGIGVGALGGALRSTGRKVPLGLSSVLLGVGAMALSDTVMTGLKITNPRTWTAASISQDALPHLTYGAVTALALHQMIAPVPANAPTRHRR